MHKNIHKYIKNNKLLIKVYFINLNYSRSIKDKVKLYRVEGETSQYYNLK